MSKMLILKKIEIISGKINGQFDNDILLCNNTI